MIRVKESVKFMFEVSFSSASFNTVDIQITTEDIRTSLKIFSQ